jgi:hypothetical protein
MLAGERPFVGANVNAVLAAIRKRPPAALTPLIGGTRGTRGTRGTPEALASVVLRCLDPARDARYRDGSALGEALLAAVAHGEHEEARAARRRLLTMAAGAAFVAAGVSVGVAALGGRQSQPLPIAADRASASARPAPLAALAAPPITTLPATASAQSPSAPPSSVAPAKSGHAVTRVNSAGF